MPRSLQVRSANYNRMVCTLHKLVTCILQLRRLTSLPSSATHIQTSAVRRVTLFPSLSLEYAYCYSQGLVSYVTRSAMFPAAVRSTNTVGGSTLHFENWYCHSVSIFHLPGFLQTLSIRNCNFVRCCLGAWKAIFRPEGGTQINGIWEIMLKKLLGYRRDGSNGKKRKVK